MNIVLLSPHFPEQHFRYAAHLKQMGAQVIGLADEPPHFLKPHVKEALSDYFWVSDMNNYEELIRICGQITYQYGKIDRIESLNEHWLETEAALRTDFNVAGIKNDTIERIKKKSEMKKVFQAHGLPCARGKVVLSLEDALAFATEVGYPLVMKPDTGVGANHTYKVHDAAELMAVFENKPQEPYILEEFISGQICSFDGLTDRSGKPVFYTSTVYSSGIMEVVNSNDHVYYYTLREVPPELKDLGMQMLTLFDVKERFFHFEFFRRPETGDYVVLEINMRPPGGPTVDMFNYSNDFDLYREWAHVVLFNHFNAQVPRLYHCGYGGRKFHKAYLHSHEEVLQVCGPWMVQHGQLSPIFRQAMGDYFYILRSGDELELLEKLAFIQATREIPARAVVAFGQAGV
ncbi:carboxylate--amine ligase [bacterium (Candidatus Blackallbacteria) CG17_big_fil_post_rev_8_21_14_2_50_48_46]|uniref:Carboxylate--amine ligase n=1 Tax=bacterium (Candidatus Blackallbacteria) CG17_big_fil_post_rev_8_21_14_2_50_48_46 TaxID=2014261 RepID=A0A2M7GA05_9BACT|nr:MAG: carboxylate--amine ligase [bacterium (Candidatus Blackallbacteria) CG18_big_fil_WC_8_21_14_2_50_49_26]PIW18979.1 MAG: carboxylate--amine ligase [bacterium (Candidatus Blackallbacteria) CG17_big_fil_post_rev_8_21_14_2_50_48_46]PIW44653.1 MAG: carboxylate--amine ligase [bacterium (Candidatus Blackallbacteria) CG13_big_fil_rev_8_21_14_2_50_49_14]